MKNIWIYDIGLASWIWTNDFIYPFYYNAGEAAGGYL